MTIHEYRLQLTAEASYCFDILEAKRTTREEKQQAAEDLDEIRRELNYVNIFVDDYPDLSVAAFHGLVEDAKQLMAETGRL